MKNTNYQVIDNFIEETEYQRMKEVIHSNPFMWFWNDNQTSNKDSYFFSHELIRSNKMQSPYAIMFKPLTDKINPSNILNIRGNLTVNTYGNNWCGKHTDKYSEKMDHITAIFYFGTNNGKTVLCPEGEEEIEIESIDNRLLMFDCNIEHYVKHATDVDRRIVINIIKKLSFVPDCYIIPSISS